MKIYGLIGEGDGTVLSKENNSQVEEKLKKEENEKKEGQRGDRWRDKIEKGREAQGTEDREKTIER